MPAEPKTYQLAVEGMSCASCAARIAKGLVDNQLNTKVNVNFAAGSATVTSSLTAQEIIAAITRLGYGARLKVGDKERAAQEAHLLTMARREVILAVLLALPVVVLGMFFPNLADGGAVQALLAALVLGGPGRGFFMRALKQLSHGQSSMDTLVSMGTATAFVFSLYLLTQGHTHLYFESAVVIIAFILVGKFLEERARQSIARAVRDLMQYQPSEALLLQLPGEQQECQRQVKLDQVPIGATVLVRPGDRFPVDGVVLRGVSTVDAAMLTGENMPVETSAGSPVAAGTINLTGPLVVTARATGEQTELAHIVALVEAAQGTKAPIQHVADQVAGWFVPAAIGVALLTLAVWTLRGFALETGLTAAVAVLVVACPCALGLATPVAIMAGTALAARRGILVKDAGALQRLQQATVIVFDKTGTLTAGRPEVVSFVPLTDEPPATILAQAGALESGSSHPLAQAIMRFVRSQGVAAAQFPKLHAVEESAGFGIQGVIEGAAGPSLMIGSLFALAQLTGGISLQYAIDQEPSEGQTYVGLARGGAIIAVFKLRDTLRPTAKGALAKLLAMGIRPILATGDGEAAARWVGRELGGLEVHFGQTPAQKAALVREVQASGECVAMAGDGINDSPALAVADVGVAMGSGADAALAVAGIILKESSITKIVEAVSLSRLTMRNIKQNLFWAFAYNIVLIPAAACGKLTPMFAGGAMALSSLFVVGNALRLGAKHISSPR